MQKASLPFPPRDPRAPAPAEPYASSLEHLLAEIARVDLLVRAQVIRARQAAGDDPLRGLSVSDDDIDAILARPIGKPHWTAAPLTPELAEARAALDRVTVDVERRRAESARRGVPLRLDALAARFALDRFDRDLILVGLAPEIDTRYERLFAYLHDDVTRKRPRVDLALGLLTRTLEDRLAARQRLAPGAPLRRHGLIHLFADPPQPHPLLIGCSFKVDDRIVDHLHGSDELDARLAPHARRVEPRVALGDLLLPAALAASLGALARDADAIAARGQVIYLEGAPGVGKRSVAEALCREIGVDLVIVNGALLATASDDTIEVAARLAAREAALLGAALYWEGFDALALSTRQAARAAALSAIEGLGGLTFLGGAAPWEPGGDLARPFVRVELRVPGAADRARLWSGAIGEGALDAGADLALLAGRYRLSGGQIHAASATARDLARFRDPGRAEVTMADLSEGARIQSNQRISSLARRITHRSTWDDLVLPPDRIERLREICDQARYREVVLERWGFGRKLTTSKGLSLLFAGPPGTGKTMTAGVLAGELGLELYQIDLAGVVSKYIGETEKNLERIFAEAESSNAVLFFDEADALFGKRSEVKDAHDRYANIETGYLLQRLESYEGVAILASNLTRNMDEAFVRRIQFTVEFPLPDERHRRRIWERAWPEGMPRDPALDLPLMAQRFEISGGNIRNIALAAAFLAAAGGEPVAQRHLFHATRREYQKMGKVIDERMFAAPAAARIR